MFLKKLELQCFRNYTHLSFSPSLQNLIVGDNGQGKTNLLESLFLLTHGRSFRAYLPESLVQEDKKAACVSAQVVEGGKSDLLLKLLMSSSGKKQFLVNGKKCSGSGINQSLPLIMLDPESLALLKGGAEHRRWWLDYWLNMRGQGVFVREFKKALVQKNRFLKQVQKGLVSSRQANSLHESLNEIFIEKNSLLVQARKRALQDITSFLQTGSHFIFQGVEEEKRSLSRKFCVGLSYLMKGMEQKEKKEGGEESFFRQKLVNSFIREREAGLSLYGAHRDDFQILFQNRDSRYFCSQGQQKGLLLALKMAQVLWLYHVRKSSCLLLLDDVFSEIDKHLVLNLLHFLEEVPSQVILTSVEKPSFLNERKFQVFNLKEGVLRKDCLSERRDQPFRNPPAP